MSTAVMCPMTASDALARLDEVLDLSSIRSKLSDPEEGKGYETVATRTDGGRVPQVPG